MLTLNPRPEKKAVNLPLTFQPVFWAALGAVLLSSAGAHAALESQNSKIQTNSPAPADKADWWSFRPAQRSPVPQVKNEHWLRNPIDQFVLDRLEREKLSPSPEADRRTVIRRVSFDLTGLIPSPEEVRDFISDPDPRAYEKLVDRLLDSPRYGERWARHWLDTVHYGETHGYDKDKTRPNAWPYRDYVIRAFNQDKPYSRFVEEQLAGDVLFPDEPDGIVALGFIAAGPWDYVGHVELPIEKTDGLIARYNDRDDMVMTTISTFQSLTVHCARCHNHKFDPISQKDYYSLQAVFAGVDRHDRPFDSDPELHRNRRRLLQRQKPLEERYAVLTNQIGQVSSPEIIQLDQQLGDLRKKLRTDFPDDPKSPGNGYHSAIEKSPNQTKWVQIDLGKSLRLDEVRLIPARPVDFPDTPGFGFPIRFRIDVADEPNLQKPETITDHTGADFKNDGDHAVTFPAEGRSARVIRVTATRLWERTSDYVFALAELQAIVNGTNAALGASVTALDSIEEGLWSKKYLVDGFDSRHRLENSRPRSPEKLELETQIRDLAEKRRALVIANIEPAKLQELVAVSNRLGEVTRQLSELPAPGEVYAAAHDFKPGGSFVPPKKARPVYLLAKGDVKRPGDRMYPAGLAAVPGPDPALNSYLARLSLAADTDQPTTHDDPDGIWNDHQEGRRRAALAKWITDPKNMLTRRSIVNRVWHYHFGRGLVETPNDFGHMGALPTHPELLDWLAFWFLDHGESLKALHRLILTSATYRQSTQVNSESAKVDADNRFLWRMNRLRLDAETIRDSMLLISGKLNLMMGGPSVQQFYFKDDHSPVYDYSLFDVNSPAAGRRSIYRFIVRSVPDPLMDSLDCPNPSILSPKRNVTTTSLQALSILNDPLVLKQSELLAERLRSEGSLEEQIGRACWFALNRPPNPEESKKLVEYGSKHGLANVCRLIFNLSEFMFVD